MKNQFQIKNMSEFVQPDYVLCVYLILKDYINKHSDVNEKNKDVSCFNIIFVHVRYLINSNITCKSIITSSII